MTHFLNFVFAEKLLNNVHNKNVAESRLAIQIISLLEHYKQKDPLGIPNTVSTVPDPFPVPPIKKSIGMGTLTMKDTMAYGFSKFRIKSVAVDVNQLTVSEKKLRNYHFYEKLN